MKRNGLFDAAFIFAGGLAATLFMTKAINKESTPVETVETIKEPTTKTELERFCFEEFGVELQTLKPSMKVRIALYKKRLEEGELLQAEVLYDDIKNNI